MSAITHPLVSGRRLKRRLIDLGRSANSPFGASVSHEEAAYDKDNASNHTCTDDCLGMLFVTVQHE
jgi:hypothetical protein